MEGGARRRVRVPWTDLGAEKSMSVSLGSMVMNEGAIVNVSCEGKIN